jgi:hypothetical protein
MRARLYTVHLLDETSDESLVLVKDGFSWPAFFLAIPWALFHRMWRVAAALVVLQIVIGVLMAFAGLSEMQQGTAWLVVALAIGFAADELRCGSLARRGYREADVVVGNDTDRATRRFLDAHPGVAIRLAGAPL